MNSDDRKRILARRASFVAAALAAISTEACQPKNEGPPPGPCLSQPMPCLEPPPPPPDEDAGPGDVPPQVCLSPVPPDPPPRVCLSQPPPQDDGPYAKPPPDKS